MFKHLSDRVLLQLPNKVGLHQQQGFALENTLTLYRLSATTANILSAMSVVGAVKPCIVAQLGCFKQDDCCVAMNCSWQ